MSDDKDVLDDMMHGGRGGTPDQAKIDEIRALQNVHSVKSPMKWWTKPLLALIVGSMLAVWFLAK